MAKEKKITYTYSCKPSVVIKAKKKSKKNGSVSELIQSLLEEYNGTSKAIPFSVKNLCERLKKDKDYYYSWQANIAMAFQDEFRKEFPASSTGYLFDLHKISNEAAKYFLNNLINH